MQKSWTRNIDILTRNFDLLTRNQANSLLSNYISNHSVLWPDAVHMFPWKWYIPFILVVSWVPSILMTDDEDSFQELAEAMAEAGVSPSVSNQYTVFVVSDVSPWWITRLTVYACFFSFTSNHYTVFITFRMSQHGLFVSASMGKIYNRLQITWMA